MDLISSIKSQLQATMHFRMVKANQFLPSLRISQAPTDLPLHLHAFSILQQSIKSATKVLELTGKSASLKILWDWGSVGITIYLR